MSRGSRTRSFAAAVTAGAVALQLVSAVIAPAAAEAVTMTNMRPVAPVVGPIGVAAPSGAAPAATRAAAVARTSIAAALAHKRRPLPARPKPPAPKFGPWRSATCSWYWEPQPLAGGGYLTPNAMIVAHKTLPFGTRIQFSYRGRTCIAVVKDRGPYVSGREFDLGPGTAKALGFDGVDQVSYRFAY